MWRISVPAPCSTLVSFRKEPSPKRARRKDVKSNKSILLAFRRYQLFIFVRYLAAFEPGPPPATLLLNDAFTFCDYKNSIHCGDLDLFFRAARPVNLHFVHLGCGT